MVGTLGRRKFIGTTAVGTMATAVGPGVVLPGRSHAAKTLRILHVRDARTLRDLHERSFALPGEAPDKLRVLESAPEWSAAPRSLARGKARFSMRPWSRRR